MAHGAALESPPPSPTSSNSCGSSQISDRNANTIDAVNWEELARRAQNRYVASSSTYTKTLSGAYNVVRFLLLNDAASTTVVVRVPSLPEDGFSPDELAYVQNRMASEVATIQFVEDNTQIPAPRIIEANFEQDGGGVGLPYVFMTYAEGQELIGCWDSMGDQDRREIIRQTVSIYLELDKHRFDRIGCLRVEATVPRRYTVGPVVCPKGSEDLPSFTRALDKCTPTTTQAEFWLACVDEMLRDIDEMDFGLKNKINDYADMYLIRTFIPSLYQSPTSPPILTKPLLDRGFRLFHGDFDSQNILMVGNRITALIDWEHSGTTVSTSFAEYPTFMMDNEEWPRDLDPDPFAEVRERNRRDCASFRELLREEELARGLPADGQRLFDAFDIPESVRYVEKLLQMEKDHSVLNKLFDCMYGTEVGEGNKDSLDVALDHIYKLKYDGELVSLRERYEDETEVLDEAQQVLGDTVCHGKLSRTEFIRVLKAHSEQLNDYLQDWLGEQD